MLFVFMSQPDFACNPHALYQYIKDYTTHETAWIIKKDERYFELLKRNIRCAVYDTMAGNQLISEADYVITNSYTFPKIAKRENQVFVNLWHGSGIKAHDFYHHDMNLKHAANLQDFFNKIDLMCVHSLDDRFKLSAQLHYDLRKCFVTGQARLDCVKKSDGYAALIKLFGEKITQYKRFIFFAPSFRANSSSHSGTIFSDNIFRLGDYDDDGIYRFLEEHDAALIYKLHPIEQTAFTGRNFNLNNRCYELTDELLFQKDIRYDELLNVFDCMISDYSSIAFDYLLLNRPLIYLIPDYKEYTAERGFVFHNIDKFMPGDKVFDFKNMLKALETALCKPEKYQKERRFVLEQRFDFQDDQSSRRCYETIINFQKIPDITDATEEIKKEPEVRFPTTAALIGRQLPGQYEVIDAALPIQEHFWLENIRQNADRKYLYITEEKPPELRKLSGQSSVEIADIDYYYKICRRDDVSVCYVSGGVDYAMFSAAEHAVKHTAGRENRRRRIGYAGTIDNRIYFSMVQCICEVFSDCDILFAGAIFGSKPVWLDSFSNLHYMPAAYECLPEVIHSFDVAILPFFGRHKDTVPKEYFQYLACGKQVVASDMRNLPDSRALYRSASVDEAVKNIKRALAYVQDIEIQESAKKLAIKYDWKIIGEKIIKDMEK